MAADEFPSYVQSLRKAPQATPGGPAHGWTRSCCGVAWTVNFTSLLVGQHGHMQELCTRQASMMAAVNIPLQELEHLLQALADYVRRP